MRPPLGGGHLLLAMAAPGTSVASTIEGLSRAATVLLPIARAFGEAKAAMEDAVERGDQETVIRHRADAERLRAEFQRAAVDWRPDGGS